MRIVAPLKELCSNSREQCVGEDILFALCSVADLCSVLLKLRLDEVGRTAGDDLVIADALLADFLVHLARQLAVFAAQHALALFGDHLIALTDKNVHNSLRTDDLAGRGNERRVTEVSTDARHFCEHIIVLVFCVCLLELRDKVRKHAARNLIQQRVGIDLKDLRVNVQLICNRTEVCGNLAELLKIKAGITAGVLQRGNEGLGCRLRGAVCERGPRCQRLPVQPSG